MKEKTQPSGVEIFQQKVVNAEVPIVSQSLLTVFQSLQEYQQTPFGTPLPPFVTLSRYDDAHGDVTEYMQWLQSMGFYTRGTSILGIDLVTLFNERTQYMGKHVPHWVFGGASPPLLAMRGNSRLYQYAYPLHPLMEFRYLRKDNKVERIVLPQGLCALPLVLFGREHALEHIHMQNFRPWNSEPLPFFGVVAFYTTP